MNAGVPVRPLGLGTMSLTGRGTWGEPADPAGTRTLLRRAAELGVQLFDTADSYGPDDGLLVATKGGFRRHGPHAWSADCSPAALRDACEGSLRRLGVERIDLYQLHVVDARVPVEESVGALTDLRLEGKVGHVGLCNVSVRELERALATTEIASVQNRFSLVDAAAEPVLERCRSAGIAFIAWAPLAKGFLTEHSGALAEIARRHDATPPQVALAWVLRRPGVLAIPGTSSLAHLEENAGAAALELTDDDVRRLERAVFLAYRAQRLVRRARVQAGRLKEKVT